MRQPAITSDIQEVRLGERRGVQMHVRARAKVNNNHYR